MASKSRRNRVKFKFTKELFFLIAFLVIILVTTIGLSIPSSSSRQLDSLNDAITDYNVNNSTSYGTLDKDNPFSIIKGGMKKKVNKTKKLANRDKYTYVFYGTLNNATYLEQLSKISNYCDEEQYDINTVYLFYADYIEEAKKNGDDDTKSFKDTISAYEDKLNSNVSSKSKEFDMTIYPTLLVYKSGELLYNSQQDEDNELDWNAHLVKAFSFEKYDE